MRLYRMDVLPTLDNLLGMLNRCLGELAHRSFLCIAFARRNMPPPLAIYIVFAAFIIFPLETPVLLEARRVIGVLAIGTVLEYFHHFLAAPTTQNVFLGGALIYILIAIVGLVFAAVLRGSDPRSVEASDPADDADYPQDPSQETRNRYDEANSDDDNKSVDLEMWGRLQRENRARLQQIQDLEDQIREVNDSNEQLHTDLRLQRTRFEQQAERNKERLADRDKELTVVRHALKFKEEDVLQRSETLKEIDDELSRIEPGILLKIGKLSKRVKRSYDAERNIEEWGEDWLDSAELEKFENRKNRESKLQDDNKYLNSELEGLRREVDQMTRTLTAKDGELARYQEIQGLRTKNLELTIKERDEKNDLLSQQLSDKTTALRSKDEELSRQRETERQALADSKADRKRNSELESKETDHELAIQALEKENRSLSQQLSAKANELTRKDGELSQLANTERQNSVSFKEDQELSAAQARNAQLQDENTKFQHTIGELREENRVLFERESIQKDDTEADFKKDESVFNRATGLCDGIEDNLKELKAVYERNAELEDEKNKIFETATKLEQKNRLLSDELTQKAEELTEKNKELARYQALDTKAVQQKNLELEKEKTDLSDRAIQLDSDKKFLSENMARRGKELNQKNDELSRYRDADARQRQQITDLEDEHGELSKKAKNLEERVQSLHEEVTEKAEELIQREGKVSLLEDRNNTLSEKITELDQKVQSLSEESAKKTEDLTWMEEEISRFRDENDKLSAKAKEEAQKNESLSEDLTKKTAELTLKEDEVSRLEDESTKLSGTTAELDQTIRSLSEELATQTTKLTQKEEELSRQKETDAAADQEDAEIIEKITNLVEKIEGDVEEIKADKAARDSTSDHSPDEPYVLVVENFEPGTTAEDVTDFLRSQDIRFCDCKVVQEEPSVTVKIYLLGLEAATYVRGWDGNLADGRELKAHFENGSESDEERYSGTAGSTELTGAVRWPNLVRGKEKRHRGQRHSL